MFVTFGILTSNKLNNVLDIIQSIELNNIPPSQYEIIVVGSIDQSAISNPNTRVINDPDCELNNWITKKKNLVISHSKASPSDFITIGKDYIKYNPEWYSGLLSFNNSTPSDIVMNRISNKAGKRYLDWIWNNPVLGDGRNINYNVSNHPGMFVPGCLVVAKKHVFSRFHFNHSMIGLNKQSDIEWSKRTLPHFSYSFNPHSSCLVFGKCSNRYPKFRRKCTCSLCSS